MCLHNISEEKIATEDMVVYKAVRKHSGFTIPDNSSGKEFTGIINGIKVKGVISGNYHNGLYFCTNESRLDGAEAYNKYGYKYSWCLDGQVVQSSIRVEGRKLFIKTTTFKTIYQYAPISLGETYKSKILVFRGTITRAIHSYVKKEDAILREKDRDVYIIKCIIPKGSRYYKGTFNHIPAIASDTIIYGKKAYKTM